MSNLVKTELKDSVYSITLDHHERRNALSLAMLNAIQEALNIAQDSAEARVITVGATGAVFCPGHEVGSFLPIQCGSARASCSK